MIGLIRMAEPALIVPHKKQIARIEALVDSTKPETALWLSRSAFTLMEDPEPSGFLTTQRVGEGIEIENFFVHPMWRKRSLGTELVKACIEDSEQLGVKHIEVPNPEKYGDAVSLFVALDFTSTDDQSLRLSL